MKKISDVEIIHAHIPDNSARFMEVALSQAHAVAIGAFGIDEDGNSSRVKGWHRSSSSIIVEFKGMRAYFGARGRLYVVEFEAWCVDGE